MYIRGNPPSLIVEAYVILIHSGIQITISELESLYIANKNFIHDTPSLIELAKKQKSALKKTKVIPTCRDSTTQN